jgi:integrase
MLRRRNPRTTLWRRYMTGEEIIRLLAPPATFPLRALTGEEIIRLLAPPAKSRLRALTLLALHGGLRPTELASLRRGDIDSFGNRLQIRNCKAKPRTIVLTPDLVAMLKQYVWSQDAEDMLSGKKAATEAAYLFPRRNGGRPSADGLAAEFASHALHTCGRAISLHDLRLWARRNIGA